MHHTFDINLASEYSIEEAILIHHFQHWIRINRELKKNNREGHWWTFQTQEWIAAHFPYWDRYKIMRLVDKLVERGVLKTGNFNKTKYDRTNWYAFADECRFLPIFDHSHRHCANLHNGLSENAQPIPDTITDTPIPRSPSPSFSSVPSEKDDDSELPPTKRELSLSLKIEFKEEEFEEAFEILKKRGLETVENKTAYLEAVILKRRQRLPGLQQEKIQHRHKLCLKLERKYPESADPSLYFKAMSSEVVVCNHGEVFKFPYSLEDNEWDKRFKRFENELTDT